MNSWAWAINTRHHTSMVTLPSSVVCRASAHLVLSLLLYSWNTCVSRGCSSHVIFAGTSTIRTPKPDAVCRNSGFRCAGQQSSNKMMGLSGLKARTEATVALTIACIAATSTQRLGNRQTVTFWGNTGVSSFSNLSVKVLLSPMST